MIPLCDRRFSGIKRGYFAWILACICLVGIVSFGYGQAENENVDDLIRQLKGSGPVAPLRATLSLGKSKDPRAVELLIEILKDEKSGKKELAAEALSMIQDLRAVEPLIATLKDKDSGVRSSSASALGSFKDPRAVEPLIASLKDKDSGVRSLSARALGAIQDRRAVEPLIATLKDADFEVRSSSASALGVFKDSRAIEPLIDTLKDKYSDVRSSSAQSLGAIGDSRAVEPLLIALGDSFPNVRTWAGLSLANLRPALTENSEGQTAAARPAELQSNEKTESDVVSKAKFTTVTPKAGKALVYFYRFNNQDPQLSDHIFSDGKLLAELNSSSYLSIDVTPGVSFFDSTLGPPGQGRYFPPIMRWPNCTANIGELKCNWDDSAKSQEREDSGCAQVNWRNISESKVEDVAVCQKELMAAIVALNDWDSQVAGALKKSFNPGEFALGFVLPPTMGSGLMADSLPRNDAPNVDINWLQICGPSPFPKLSSSEAQEFYNSPISSRGRTRCFTELLEATHLLRSKERLTVEAEERKTYYVELSPTEMQLVDAATGLKRISLLQYMEIFNAACVGDLVSIKSLIDAKADVNAKPADGFTALMWASGNGHLEIVKALIDAEADVNAKRADGFTALMWASGSGHLETVKALIDAKADVNAITTNGITAFKLASANRRTDVMRLLKDAGAAGN